VFLAETVDGVLKVRVVLVHNEVVLLVISDLNEKLKFFGDD
jgi:hypothetical protein